MDRKQNPNLEILLLAVDKLGDLSKDMTFVGGCITGLLINKPTAPPIRATRDVDAIIEVVSLQDYHKFAKRLRECGFSEDINVNAPLCRYVSGTTILDVMPTREDILKFGNPWYTAAVKNSEQYQFANGVSIGMISAPYFIMTKLEAFDGRGQGDYLTSHDLEDVIAVLDGRNNIIEEIKNSGSLVVKAMSSKFQTLLSERRFRDSIMGHVPSDDVSQARVPLILDLISEIATFSE